MSIYLTKNAPQTKRRPDVVKGSRQVAECKFFPAAGEELKALGDNIPDGYIAGWASTDTLDLYQHRVMNGAFTDAIDKRGLNGPKAIKLLIGHDWDKVAGVIKVLEYRRRTWTTTKGTEVTADALWIEAQMNLNISYVRDTYEATKMLGGMNFSVGFMLQDYQFKEADDKSEYLQIDRGDLFEVSIVPFPGNEEATLDFVKNAKTEGLTTMAEFEKLLVSKGWASSRTVAHQIALAAKSSGHLFQKGGGSPAPTPPVKTNGPLLDSAKLSELSDLVSKMRQAIAPVGVE